MKNGMTLIALFLTALVYGQSEGKLFQNSNHIGGYGGLNFMVNPASKLAFSGEGAFIYKNYYLGGFGGSTSYGNFTSSETNRVYEFTRDGGGFMVGAVSNSSQKLALFAEVRVGFGEMLARTQLNSSIFEEYEADVVTTTPMAGICYNPNRYVQFRLYGGYEQTNAFNLVGIENPETNGAVFGLAFYFGYF